MNDITTLTLLPQDRLTLASGLESQDLQRYRRLSKALATRHADISRVVADLGAECEQQLDALTAAAERVELAACVTRDEAPAIPSVEAMSVSQALKEALDAADEASRLSRLLLDTNSTPELETALLAFARHKQQECRQLRECLTVHVP
ncbi:hypothetical protein [Halomonas organivorans]|uniref:DUF2383 domain-containing protein n=1 Tax=Halomonas organivorans TaxID=257772 RepID=A0A7W5G6H0_9GAMM|nr:hypothetical protein [Halomonas organivorans]MBB3142145.1 hypothetical protein [Halomonas organivorans]